MLIAITCAAGMTAAYRPDGFCQIQAKVLSSPGLTLVALDDASSMSPFGVPARATDPTSLTKALTQVVKAVQNQDLQGILILGGDSIFPYWEVTNTVQNPSVDPDSVILTDNPYAAVGNSASSGVLSLEDWLNPSIPIGRIAAGTGDSAASFCALIDNLIANRNHQSPRTGYVEFTNLGWAGTSAAVASILPGPGRLLVSPNDRVDASTANELDCQFLYCNLHGFTNDPAWKGFDPGYSQPVVALTSSGISSQYVSGTVVFTEACYGLQTQGRPTNGSIALSLLAAGAAGVIGSTGLAFGSFEELPQNLIDADALTRSFLQSAASGQSLGASLQAARKQFMGPSAAGLDPYQIKTLLQFQLLGDPTFAI